MSSCNIELEIAKDAEDTAKYRLVESKRENTKLSTKSQQAKADYDACRTQSTKTSVNISSGNTIMRRRH